MNHLQLEALSHLIQLPAIKVNLENEGKQAENESCRVICKLLSGFILYKASQLVGEKC